MPRKKLPDKPTHPRPPRPRISEPEDVVGDESEELSLGIEENEEVGEPDPVSLSAVGEEHAADETLDLEDPRLAAELSEDPVRLYLREIGQVKLLDSDSEFRLATQIEADRLSKTFCLEPRRKGAGAGTSVYHAVLHEMVTSWQRLGQDAERLKAHLPDLGLMLAEAQALQHGWEVETPSYLRAYLDNGRWGRDTLWDGLARHAYNTFLCLYMLPGEFAEWLQNHIRQRGDLPVQRTLYRNLPGSSQPVRFAQPPASYCPP